MSDNYINEPMLEIYLFETTSNIQNLESLVLRSETNSSFTQDSINEIFRILHTIKGSSSMMLYDGISSVAHSIEDLFYYIREKKDVNFEFDVLSELIFNFIDFAKVEIEKIKCGDPVDGDSTHLINDVKDFLNQLIQLNPSKEEVIIPTSNTKQQYYIQQGNKDSTSQEMINTPMNYYKTVITFEDGCEMENIRAYTIVHNLNDITQELFHFPQELFDNEESVTTIRERGFILYIKTDKHYEEMYEIVNKSMFLKELEFTQLEEESEFEWGRGCKTLETPEIKIPEIDNRVEAVVERDTGSVQSIISVNVTKLDKLMDLVGEMVIAEAMVTQNPDLKGLELENFQKASRQLRKITSELQDTVMSIRMIPMANTFNKMQRVVRDMSKKLCKEIKLEILGEETEVDKNIIEHISDPIMHLVRNAIDHGIESSEERVLSNKPKKGTVTLEAKNVGSDVLVMIKDDGRGLNKNKILQKARDHGLIWKKEDEMTDKEIYNLIFLPGFSTKEGVSEYSGRGVGMDVVLKNIDEVGGSASIESIEGVGSTITLKIPLTLAIIEGMNIKVGNARYTLPTTAIKQSFRPKESEIIIDPNGNEMIMVRGQCYPILRLHSHFGVNTKINNLSEGILIMIDQDERSICIFADGLIGHQQVVVKSLPNYIRKTNNVQGLAGCTLLGDGSISLILDIGGLINAS